MRLFPLASMAILTLAACSPPAEPEAPAAADTAVPATAPAAPAPAVAPLPTADVEAAKRLLSEGGTVEAPDFARTGSTTVRGTVRGYAAPVYAVPVAAGQTLTVDFQTPSANLYVNVIDAADDSGAAVHRGEVDGPRTSLKAERDMTYLITPFQPRAMARRNESGDFTLVLTRD